METTRSEYEFCQKILDNYDKFNDSIRKNQGCSHDRSKERELYERSTTDKLKAIRLFCDEGNIKYKDNKIEEAILEYKNALIYVDYTFPENKNLEEEYNQLITRINLNLSACFLKISEFNMAILHCNNVLKNDPNNIKVSITYNVSSIIPLFYDYLLFKQIPNKCLFTTLKALYRLSQAYINIYEFNKAIEIIDKVLSNQIDDKSAFIKLRNDIVLMESKYKNSNTDKYKRMFNKN
ncbi:TPR repeat family protein [Cryptosporidium meleagridis]|uniref:TPR repeat family protein n=1 Tax=Cryptosporidium meleagridis TaxID=93969 RepID=A0A2P4Z1G9_9CRYT|nr:TPR repeat family protein [Cryptosporidium meleagridis]